MKKIIFLFALIIIISIPSSGQLTVIDQIVNTLIPGVVNGVNSVLSSSNKKGKVDSSKVGVLKKDFEAQLASVVDKMSKDQSNIDALNNIFLKTSSLLGYISAMQTLSEQEFLNQVTKSNSPGLNYQIVRSFQRNWAAFSDQINDLSKIQDVGNNPTLQSQLNFFSSQVGNNLKTLNSDIKFLSTPNISSKEEDVEKYVDNLNSSSIRNELNNIIQQILMLNSALSGYISSFSTSIKEGKASIKDKL